MSTAAPAFRFACHRCGYCCSGGEGRVWLEPGEEERIAAALSTSAESFVARHVRDVVDPASGRARRALRERDGRCTLLADANACVAYDARPAQCRSFPFWPDVLATSAGFEAARAVCPGIAVEVDAATRARAFARLAGLYAAVDRAAAEGRRAEEGGEARAPADDAGARCCLDDRALEESSFATGLEADHAIAAEIGDGHRAPCDRAPRDGGCRLGRARPLGCRLARAPGLSDDERERFVAELRALEDETGYPRAYGRLALLLETRRAGARSGGVAQDLVHAEAAR